MKLSSFLQVGHFFGCLLVLIAVFMAIIKDIRWKELPLVAGGFYLAAWGLWASLYGFGYVFVYIPMEWFRGL